MKIQAGLICGKYVNLREVTLKDAKFILDLRCDPKKSKHLNKTEYNLQKQEDYISRYFTLDDEYYFIIEDKQGNPKGTIRIYDIKDKQYTGGSWLMVDEATSLEAIEGDFLLNDFAFNVLGMELDAYDVRKANKKMVRFHLNRGAKIVSENEIDYFFELTKEEFNKNKQRLLQIIGVCE